MRLPWKRDEALIHYTEDGRTVKVMRYKPIVTPYPNPFRHPVYWWRMRHLRADLRAMEREPIIGLEIANRFEEMLDRELLHGRG